MATREDLCKIAIAENGYKETGDNQTKYAQEMWGKNGMMWCATFVSWCAKHAGITQSECIYTPGCASGVAFFKKNNRFHLSAAYSQNPYQPLPGDIIFFLDNKDIGNANAKSHHVGIVIGFDNKSVFAMEGNTSNAVHPRRYTIACHNILGYGVWTNDTNYVNHASEYSSLNTGGLKRDGYVGGMGSSASFGVGSSAVGATNDLGGGSSSSGGSSGQIGSGYNAGYSSEYRSTAAHEEYSGDNGTLTGTTIYYNIGNASTEAGTQKMEVEETDPETGEKIVVLKEVVIYKPEDSALEQCEEDNPNFDDEENKESGLTEQQQAAADLLNSAATEETISGIQLNADGTYTQGELLDVEEVMKSAQQMMYTTDLLCNGLQEPQNCDFQAYEEATGNSSKADSAQANAASASDDEGSSKALDAMDATADILSGTRNLSAGTGQIQAGIKVYQACDKYGRAIKQGMACSVCGTTVPYMPTQGYCSVKCFAYDLTQHLLTHMKRDDADPVTQILERISKILDFMNLIINLIVDLPDLLTNISLLPNEIKNYLMVYVNIVFLKLRWAINWLMIKKNEGIIYVLKKLQKGLSKKSMQKVFAAIDVVIEFIHQLQSKFEAAYAIAMKALKSYGITVKAGSYAWMCTPRSLMNADSGQLLINIPENGLIFKELRAEIMGGIANGVQNIAPQLIDKVDKVAFPPIQTAEYFMDPDLFTIRLFISDQSMIRKLYAEMMEMLMVCGFDYMPRWKRLSFTNPWFIMAILDGWAFHGMREFGSFLQPMY